MTDLIERLYSMQGMGDVQLKALMDGVGPKGAEEIEQLRAELSEQCRLLGMSAEREAKHLAQIAALEKERDALRAELDALKAWKEEAEKQEPVAIVDYKRGSCIRWVEYLGWQKIKDGAKLYALPGAQPAPSVPDTHNDMVVGLDYQGAMSCARKRAKQEAGLLYPEGDARKEEKERELAGEYYRQYTTPNPGAKP